MTNVHSLVLGIADPAGSAHLRRLIASHARFELVGLADTAVATMQLVERLEPSVVLLADESPGLRGRDVLAEIAQSSPDSLVIITTPGDPEALIGRPAVAESVAEHDLDAVVTALTSLADFLDDPDGWAVAERRCRADRRQIQDWTQVFAERRREDRRQHRSAPAAES
jgi:chemotaxis response regulator CheB